MRWGSAVGIVCALALAGCSGSSGNKANTIVGSPTTASASSSTDPNALGPSDAIDPCKLLTAADASLLVGTKVTRSAADKPGSGGCSYASPGLTKTVEIFIKIDPDGAYAQADYPAWVQSVIDAPGFTITPVPKFADGATEIRSAVFDAMLFRKDTVLVKIGVDPKATHVALVRAATTALGRL